MSMSIRTNVSSLNAQRNLASTEGMLNDSLSKLSSGFRITKAKKRPVAATSARAISSVDHAGLLVPLTCANAAALSDSIACAFTLPNICASSATSADQPVW